MDTISPQRRSENMRSIRSRDTKPELVVRSLAHRLGYRFRLHRKDLAGRPDLVFPGRCKVVFVHGCFWHQHSNCIDGRLPKSRISYWTPKLRRNKKRDKANRDKLRRLGWQTFVVWDCDTKNLPELSRRLNKFLLT